MDRVDYQSLIVQDIVNLEKAGELNLRPWYQRRSTWTSSQQSYLINTIFERKPIPAIYIRHALNLEKGISVKEIVDGQQRTRSILDYCKGNFTARLPNSTKRVKFGDLSKAEHERFLLTAIPVGYLLGATDADVIDIFARINSVSKTLNAQEKRNALFSGEFKQFAVEQAVQRTEFWRMNEVFSDTDISRMLEVQFVSDLILNLLNGLSDFTPARLNKLYEEFDADFPRAKEISDRLERIFTFISSLDPDAIAGTIFSRQPLFFSLFLVLDSIKSPKKKTVEAALFEMDDRFLDEDIHSVADMEFVKASAASTQRITQRNIRDNYIRKFIK